MTLKEKKLTARHMVVCYMPLALDALLKEYDVWQIYVDHIAKRFEDSPEWVKYVFTANPEVVISHLIYLGESNWVQPYIDMKDNISFWRTLDIIWRERLSK